MAALPALRRPPARGVPPGRGKRGPLKKFKSPIPDLQKHQKWSKKSGRGLLCAYRFLRSPAFLRVVLWLERAGKKAANFQNLVKILKDK